MAAWVADFLEGLGLDRVAVLAAEPCCLSALELALLNAGQVERLVLVPAGAVGETGLDGTLATTLAGVSVPLIVVRRGLRRRGRAPPVEAVPRARESPRRGGLKRLASGP